MCGSQVCCWLAAEASLSPPIHSVCSPHTLAEGISSAGLLCAVGGKVRINVYHYHCSLKVHQIFTVIYIQFKQIKSKVMNENIFPIAFSVILQ